jgi:hypothetical protein
MRGQLTIVYPDKPMELRLLGYPPNFADLQMIVGGTVQIVPHWDQNVDFDGVFRQATVIVNEDAPAMGLQVNHWATAMWHFVARAKGHRINQPLTGPVVIATGDDEFLNAFLE